MNNAVKSVDLDRVVLDVFETMLGERVSIVDHPWTRDMHRLTASVHFAGPSPGALMIECSKRDACRVAELLTGIPHHEVNDDVLDGLGELANMVGGNLKSMLHAGAGLSMPCVVEGSDYSMRICGDRPIRRFAFGCRQAVFWVTYVSER